MGPETSQSCTQCRPAVTRACVCGRTAHTTGPERAAPRHTLTLEPLEPKRFGHFSLALRISSFGNSSPLPCSRGTLARAHERPRTHRTLGVGDASPMDGRRTLLHRRPHALRRAARPDGQLQRPRGRADNYKPTFCSSRRLRESFSCGLRAASSGVTSIVRCRSTSTTRLALEAHIASHMMY